MTHTFEVQVCLNYSTYQYLLENLPSLTKVGKKYRTNYYSKKGITQIELIKYVANDNSFTSFYLKLRCNLSLIMGENDILLLDDNKYSVHEMLEQFRKRLHEINQLRYINLHEYNTNEFSVTRVDFVVDILLDNPNILVYLSNMSMQHNYKNLKRTKINKKANVLYYESCHYQSYSRTLNIYSKYKSVINSSRTPPSVIEEVVKQTLRVEIQVKKNGLKSLKRILGRKLTLLDVFDKDICNNYILNEIGKLYKPIHYVSLNKAIEIIIKSNYTNNKKKVLISILRTIHTCCGVDNLTNAVKCNTYKTPTAYGDVRKFKLLLNEIYNLGIQVATIPNGYGITEHPSLYEILTNKLLDNNGGKL